MSKSNISHDLQVLALKVQKTVLSANSGDISETEFAKLKSEYIKLKNKYQFFDSSSLQNELSEEDLSLFHYLELGFEHKTASYKSVLKGIVARHDQAQFDAHVFLQEFFKNEGYRNIHQSKYSDLNQKDKEYIRSIFGGVLGVDIIDECMASVRLEQLADLWMYVASKNHLEDIKEYHVRSKNKQFKEMYGTLGHYLVEQLSARKKTVIYRLDETTGTVAAVIDSRSSQSMAHGTIAGSYRSDSCYINSQTKEIYICAASLNTDISNKSQLSTLAKICHALELTLKQTEYQTEYHAYSVKSHILHGGFFPITNLLENQNKSKFDGKALIQTLGWDKWDDMQKQKAVEAFSLYPIIFYLSEQNPSSYVAETLLHSNLASLGCDTLGFYQRKEELKNATHPLKEFSLDILQNLTTMVDFLADEQVCISIHGDGKVKLTSYLKALSNAISNYMYNFPPHLVGENNEYSDAHIQGLLNLANSCKILTQKIKIHEQTFEGSNITKEFHTAYLTIKNLENIQDSIESLPSQKRVYQYDKAEEKRLIEKYDIQSTLTFSDKQDLLLNIAKNLARALERNDFSFLAAIRDSEIFGAPPQSLDNIIDSLEKHSRDEAYDPLCGYLNADSLSSGLSYCLNNHHGMWVNIMKPLQPLFKGDDFDDYEFLSKRNIILNVGQSNSKQAVNTKELAQYAYGSYITNIASYLIEAIPKKRHPIYAQIRDSAKPPSQKKASRKKQ